MERCESDRTEDKLDCLELPPRMRAERSHKDEPIPASLQVQGPRRDMQNLSESPFLGREPPLHQHGWQAPHSAMPAGLHSYVVSDRMPSLWARSETMKIKQSSRHGRVSHNLIGSNK